MVSPSDKNGGDVTGNGLPAVAATSGDAIAYASRGSFGDTVGSGVVGMTQYVARRGAADWTSTGVTPTPQYDAPVALAGVTELLTFSDDLRRAAVWAYDLPAVSGEAAPTPNLYSEDTLTHDLELVSVPLAGPVPFADLVGDFNIPNVAGVSRDSRHIAFKALSHLLPDAPSGVPSVYEWDTGTLRLASVLPDGTIPADGAILASPTAFQQTYRETVSPDGTRVLFLSPPTGGQLYARVDHARTVWVSQPETSGGSAPAPENVMLQQVTGDSRHIVFSTTSRLLDSDTNSGNDLYLYTDTPDPATDSNLTLVTHTGDIPSQPVVVGSSDDGSRIYYYQNEQLKMWSSGVTRVVASGVTRGDWNDITDGSNFTAAASAPGAARVTPDGRYLAFWTRSTVAGGANPAIGSADGHAAIYLYDAAANRLRCASCPAQGSATADASILPDVTHISPELALPGIRPSFLASDGRVFFSTDESLVASDVNGVTDAYQFDPAAGETSLVSTGNGSEPAAFVDASTSGDDVFIITRQRLRKADRDSLADLYDARIGPVFPDAPDTAPPCEGDACQGPPTAQAGDATIGSLTFEGAAHRDTSTGRLRLPRSRTLVGWHGSLRVVVPSRGSMRWSGRGVRPGARAISERGAQRLPLALMPRFRARLMRWHVVRTELQVTFRQPDGSALHATVRLRFTIRPKRGASR